MRVLVVEPEKKPYTKEIENSLKALQDIVGGYIQVIQPWEDEVAIICNEEGKIMQLPLNRIIKNDNGRIFDIVVGTFVIAGFNKDCFLSIDDKMKDKYENMFETPGVFL